jgi:hypothetical protein
MSDQPTHGCDFGSQDRVIRVRTMELVVRGLQDPQVVPRMDAELAIRIHIEAAGFIRRGRDIQQNDEIRRLALGRAADSDHAVNEYTIRRAIDKGVVSGSVDPQDQYGIPPDELW